MDMFWNCKALAFDNLPTVRELLHEADADVLAAEVAEQYARGELLGLSAKQLGRIRKRAHGAIGEMKQLEPKRPSRKRVLLPDRSYDLTRDSWAIGVGTYAACVDRADLEKAALAGEAGHVDRYSILFDPWRKVLSYRVWMPDGLSRRERYLFLADIVEEMTHFGWDAATAKANRKAAWRELESRVAVGGDGRLVFAEHVHRDFGLESTTDDYHEEYERRMADLVWALNAKEGADFAERVADLARRLRAS